MKQTYSVIVPTQPVKQWLILGYGYTICTNHTHHSSTPILKMVVITDIDNLEMEAWKYEAIMPKTSRFRNA